ncbi:MAG: TraB/GumN family protein [Sphingomonas sp.]
MTRALALLLAAIAALLPAGCSRQPMIAAHPALWRVSDGDTTIWLLGTIHLLPANVDWQTPAVRQAIATADTLVTEIPEAPANRQAATFLAMARAPGLPPMLDRVQPAERAQLRCAAAAANLPLTTLDGMKSWAAAVTLAVGAGKRSGASGADGVEATLFDAFDSAGKRKLAFESLKGQLALFDALPEDHQRLLLVRSAAEALSARSSYQATLQAWAAGDPARIAASFDPTFKGAPALEDALLTARNRRWSAWIARRMNQPGTVLVAVGAGHLVGPRSVIAMLRARGLAVVRVE